MNAKMYTRKLRIFIMDTYLTQRAAAKDFGVSPQVLCPVTKGRKIHHGIARRLGYKIVKTVVITYEPIEGEEQWF